MANLDRIASVLLLCATPLAAQQAEPAQKPWRLDAAAGTPDWLRISGHTRLRWEGINGQFRAAGRLANSDHLAFQRTALRIDADLNPVALTLEVLDSRNYGGGSGSSINTGNVNPLDILQGYAELDLGEIAGLTGQSFRVGRYTMDVGSRRLVARNRFRNTINSFTGLKWNWDVDESTDVGAFWNLPVRRKPRDLSGLVDNELDADDQDIDNQFFGLYLQRNLGDKLSYDAYVFFLDEDNPGTRRRQIVTPGVQVRRTSGVSEFDYELEAALQVGDSRLSSGGPDLDHEAWFLHASAGYTFDATWTPRVRVAFDYASGDRDTSDGDNQRFDTLFGARRFEYGPTGIYGAIARSNLLSPELRVVMKPRKNVNWMVAARGALLASDNDTWTTAGVADPTGRSGREVGLQLETRLRWDYAPKSVRLETGFAVMFAGDFQRDAVGGQDEDTYYGYVQAAWTF